MSKPRPLPTTWWQRLVDRLGDWRRTPHLRAAHQLMRNPPDIGAAFKRGNDEAQADPRGDALREAFARARREALGES